MVALASVMFSPIDRAQFEAEVLCGVFEWLEPENVDRLLELARGQNRTPIELVLLALRRASNRPGISPQELEERKKIFRQLGLDWENFR